MSFELDQVPSDRIAEFCRKHHIRRLAVFGSALRDDFTADSDIDLLVEFEPGTRIGFIGLAGLEIALAEMLGRQVDLNTALSLSKYFRDKVLSEAEELYAAA